MSDSYLVPRRRYRLEEEIKRSRFIASVDRADSVDQAREFLQTIRAEFPDASHNCYAWVVGPPGTTLQVAASDDGEPRGTAGRPMLHTLLHQPVGDVAAVVTRYFGGTKLGAAGLVRAYSGVLARAMQRLPTEARVFLTSLTCVVAYTHLETIQRLADEFGAREVHTEYTDLVRRTLAVPRDEAEALHRAIREATAGQALFE